MAGVQDKELSDLVFEEGYRLLKIYKILCVRSLRILLGAMGARSNMKPPGLSFFGNCQPNNENIEQRKEAQA